MRIALVTFVIATLLGVGCKDQGSAGANQNTPSIGPGKKLNPKDQLLGHWRIQDKARDFYFSSNRTIAVGEVIEDQGITRHEWTYKVLQTNEDESSILVQPSFGEPDGFGEGKTVKYTFDGKGGMKVENYKGRKVETTFQCQYMDARQEP